MSDLHLTDCIIAVSTLVKRQGHDRQGLNATTKDEENGVAGAADERKKIVRKMQNMYSGSLSLTHLTERYSDACHTAALALDTGRPPGKTDHTILELARDCLLFGVRDPALSKALTHVAGRAEEVAQKSRDKLGVNESNFQATALLAQLTNELPKVNFNVQHPDVRGLRQQYQSAINKVRKR